MDQKSIRQFSTSVNRVWTHYNRFLEFVVISLFSCSHFGLTSIPSRRIHSCNFATVHKLFGNFRIRKWYVWITIGLHSRMQGSLTWSADDINRHFYIKVISCDSLSILIFIFIFRCSLKNKHIKKHIHI